MVVDFDWLADELWKRSSLDHLGHGSEDPSSGIMLDERQFLSIGLPWLTPIVSRRWIGQRVCLFSECPGRRHRTSLVSSRLKKQLDLQPWWFDVLRSAVLSSHPESACLVVVSDTAPARAVRRASQLFNRRVMHFRVCPGRLLRSPDCVSRWLRDAVRELSQAQPASSVDQHSELQVLVSPEIGEPTGNSDAAQSNPILEFPLEDRLLFAAADRIQVLSVRAAGQILRLIDAHLRDSERVAIPVLIASDESRQLPNAVSVLPPGWTPWLFEGDTAHVQEMDRDVSDPNPSTAFEASLLTNPDDWLLHWTRAASGPWPGESEDDYLDHLILRTGGADHSALATLCRILCDGVLRASTTGIRGGFGVVAFTAVPLCEFRERRIFRGHRTRFDFEPWGIAIRKSVLLQKGARPVIYGDEAVWQTLPEEQRPWFQKIIFEESKSTLTEKEWRIQGDLILKDLRKEDLCVFVDSVVDAHRVRQMRNWSVTVTPD
jgi:hypothetical protein